MKLKKNGIGAFIVLSILIGGAVIYFSNISPSPREYTIGTVDNIYKAGRQGLVVEYVYVVNGTRYEGNRRGVSVGPTVEKGVRFVVRYMENEPEISTIMYGNPVPDEVQTPDISWNEIPEWPEKN